MENATSNGVQTPPRRMRHVARALFMSGGFALSLALATHFSASVAGVKVPGQAWMTAYAGQDDPSSTTSAESAEGIAEAADAAAAELAAKAVKQARSEINNPGEPELSDEMRRVRDWVAGHYRVPKAGLQSAFEEVEVSARDKDFDPLLLVAIIAVESSFNPKAKSHAGALGLMQVIPRWHMDKIGRENGPDALYDPRFNVQVGTQVLAEGMQRYGSLEDALQYYNGARNDPERRYTRQVMSVKNRLLDVARAKD